MTSVSPDRAFRSESWALIALAVVYAAGAVGMVIAGNSEGVVGGVLFAGILGVPALALGLWLRSSRAGFGVGVLTLLLALFYAGILAGNWQGYEGAARVLAPLALVPAIAVFGWVFVATARHSHHHHAGRRPGPSPS